MSDKREWFYPAGDGSESVGPLTTEQVAEKLRSGELKVDDYIWGSHFADQDWRRIFELEELRPHLPVRQAPKPRVTPPVRVSKPDDEEATLVDNPIQRAKDHPDIADSKSDPGFVKALADAPAPEVKAPEVEPEIVRNVPVPTEVPAPVQDECRAIDAPTEDFVSEIERTNPSISFKRDPKPSQDIQPPSGVREMTLDSFMAQTEAQPPAARAPVAPPPVPALPPLEESTAFVPRPSTENTVLTQCPPELAPQSLPLVDDKTVPSVETLLGHVRAEEPKQPEPAPPPPVTATTPESVTAITLTPISEEQVTSQAPIEPTPVEPTKTPSGGTHMGGGRVSGTGSHMSTRIGNTNFGGGQSRFTTPKQEAFHAQTDDFKATHDEPGEYGAENAYRRYPRVPFNTEVIMRDDREYHRFRSIDISEKGVRIKVEDISLFNKGEEIMITVRSAPGIGTFSCKGVVMRILRADEGPGYGIFFMQLNPNIRRRITQFVLDQMSARLNRSATRGGPAAA